MRLLVASGSFYPEVGGPSTFLWHVCAELVRRGVELRVATLCDRPGPSDLPYPVRWVERGTSKVWRQFRFRDAILEEGEKADLVFACDYGLPALWAARRLRVPLVMRIVLDYAWEVCERNGLVKDDVDTFQRRLYLHPKVWAAKWARTKWARGADHIVVPGEYVRGLVQSWGVPPERVTLVRNVGPAPLTPDPARREAVRARFGLSGTVVASSGRLIRIKRVDQVVRIVRDLPGAPMLLVLGDGPERGALERLAAELGMAERVRFPGTIPPAEVAATLAACDAFVLNSVSEGLPHSVLEAQAAGVPVVATRICGTPEVVEDGVTGLLVAPDAPEELRRALARLLEDRAFAEALARRAVERFAPRGWNDVTNELSAVLDRVLAARRV